MINIEQLTYRYPGSSVPALDKVSLQINRQSLFGLLGPNGAGKTTLLSLISGSLNDASGRIYINGLDITNRSSRASLKISLVPQNLAFYERLSVIENLTFFAGVQGLPAHRNALHIEKAIATCELGDWLNTTARNLSGGLKRRLNVAIGLLSEPDVLILDEPTVGIDPHSRYFMLDAIRMLNKQGMTVIYSSHHMEEIHSLCDQIAILDHGKVLIAGSLEELLFENRELPLQVTLKEPLTDDQSRLLEQFDYQQSDKGLNGQLLFRIHSSEHILQILKVLQQHHVDYMRIQQGAMNLEELFLDLTRRNLRDNP